MSENEIREKATAQKALVLKQVALEALKVSNNNAAVATLAVARFSKAVDLKLQQGVRLSKEEQKFLKTILSFGVYELCLEIENLGEKPN